jgi:hypothetical protein
MKNSRRRTMKMMKNTVVEVKVQLGNKNNGSSFNSVINNQLEVYREARSTLTEKFQIVNCLGCDPKGDYFIEFITFGNDLQNSQQTVEKFIKELIRDLNDLDQLDYWDILLEGEDIPSVKGFEIVCTRPNQN